MQYLLILAAVLSIPSYGESFRQRLIQRMAASGLTPEQQVQHVANRLYYGGHADLLQQHRLLIKNAQGQVLPHATRAALADAIVHSIHGMRAPHRGLEERIKQLYPVLRLTYAQRLRRQANLSVTEISRFRHDLRRAEIARKILHSVASPRPFFWVLSDFWFNHFNVSGRKAPMDLEDYRKGLQRKMFTKFPQMLMFTAKHPAMLHYLDNARNRSPQPNENYAREIMELHTLGVGPERINSQGTVIYRQRDIRQAARLLSGWGISRVNDRGRQMLFRPAFHAPGPKEIMGRRYDVGAITGEQAIEKFILDLAKHPRTAQNVAIKLVRHFVSETPFAPGNLAIHNLTRHLARRYLATNGDLVHLYETLFSSAAFWSQRAYLSKTKRPLEFVVSALRATGASRGLTKIELDQAFFTMKRMGQEVLGFPAPTGFADDSRVWTSQGNALEAMRYAQRIAEYKGDNRDKASIYERCEGPKIEAGCHFQRFFELFRGNSYKRFFITAKRQRKIRDLIRTPDRLRSNGEGRILRSALAAAIGSAEFQRK